MQKSAQVSKGISQTVSQCSDNINVHNIKIRTLSGDIITIKSMLSKLAFATKQVPNAKAGCQDIDRQSFVVPSSVTLDAGSAFKNILLTNGRSGVLFFFQSLLHALRQETNKGCSGTKIQEQLGWGLKHP
ncbi:hypothetical protein BCR44DRAFT_1038465 [Catenaria anguillulae PL171]|uniref:Uncharacterized protein n=1 Tax=Catenaria anguillulae PL171 TaxID=765915 RepID=A0A1Y2H5S0_9FUNG|nr:hypothetical protein BCR44DRAFT_1038465 [Catenaria anguillulae PL171]